MNYQIIRYSDEFKEKIIDLWEKSVIASHDFLTPEDFLSIKIIVEKIDFNLFEVFCLILNDELIGFLGVESQKIEMLFLLPNYFGKGYGKILIDFAIQNLGAFKVDVNEQNHNAVKFYKKCGFQTFERSELDDQGNNYPLLRMKIASN
jgi:putative acetyltransferase